jgi:hypothetical protein
MGDPLPGGIEDVVPLAAGDLLRVAQFVEYLQRLRKDSRNLRGMKATAFSIQEKHHA